MAFFVFVSVRRCELISHVYAVNVLLLTSIDDVLHRLQFRHAEDKDRIRSALREAMVAFYKNGPGRAES